MSALLHLMMGSARRKQLVTRTFTSNTSFPVPAGVTILLTASGKGAAGNPGSPGTAVQKTEVATYLYRRDTGATDNVVGNVNGWPYGSSSYCDGYKTYTMQESTVYQGYNTCYRPFTTYEGGSNATTGASATGFGRTFPGGSGGAASTTTFNNVAVTPLASYSIVVPSGGSITITYEI